MSQLSFFVVDAFTNRLFSGNPAAVVPLTSWPSAEWLQNVAMEMNHAETAFIVPNGAGYDLRWFTPMVEVDLCGHATIATAQVLAELGQLPEGGEVAFSTRSGRLTAQRAGKLFQLNFPRLAVFQESAPPKLLESLGVTPTFVGRSQFDYFLELGTAEEVRAIRPDFKQLGQVDCRGVIVTARSDETRFDFISRFFGPSVGIDEDPVTGSAHCCLADYWSQKLGRNRLVGYQASRRGGVVHVEAIGDRVLLGGEAVIFARGTISAA